MIENIIKSWPGRVQLITGRPRHSQTQGLVELGNYTVERMLSALFCDTGSNSWASRLPQIQCKTILDVESPISTLNYVSLMCDSQYTPLQIP